MKFGIDTCTWLKIVNLEHLETQILDVLLSNFQIFVTHDVLSECLHFLPEEKTLFEQVEVLPRINRFFQDYEELGFDSADASLLEYADMNNFRAGEQKYVIITEDPEMLRLNVTGAMRIIKFVDFLVLLQSSGYLKRKVCQELVLKLYLSRNITKRKKKTALQRLQELEENKDSS